MLEYVPEWLGHALEGVRAGVGEVAIAHVDLAGVARLAISSPAFADGGRLPDRFTDDGAGVSPPLAWGPSPTGTARLALLVEDADSPTPRPLVHAVLWNLPADGGTLAEGGMVPDAASGVEVGRNSFRSRGWLPPDPPRGHGEHRYVFQLFALDASATPPRDPLGRTSLLEALDGHVVAAGMMVGTYSRADPAATGPVGAVATG